VRLVNSLFTSKADWDDQLESWEKGWPAFLSILRIYLTHFAGQPTATVQAITTTTLDADSAWRTLSSALGLAGARPGDRRSTAGLEAPPLAGVVESAGERDLMLRLEQPHQGVAYVGGCAFGGQTMVSLGMMLYGSGGAQVAARDTPRWQAWLAERFPAAVADPVATS
jgi:hypothetical protein